MQNYELGLSNPSAQITPLGDVLYLNEKDLKQCSQSATQKSKVQFKNDQHWNYWGDGLLKVQILKLYHRATELGSLSWDPEIWICNKHPGDPSVYQKFEVQ